MTPLSAPLPAADTDRHPGLDPLENPWLILWRTLWFDVPILWANEIDRLLDREAGPLTDAAPLPMDVGRMAVRRGSGWSTLL